MRILMLDNEFPPLGGGTGVVNYHMLKEMSAHEDIWIDLVTSSRSRDEYETEQFAERVRIYKVPVNNQNIHHSTNAELIRYAWRGLHLSRKLAERHDYDISFAFAGVPAGGISYALEKLAGLPYLISLQGPDVPGFEARYNYLYPALKPVVRRIWRNASAVTAISQEHQRLALETMPDLEIQIIPNGADVNNFRPSESPRQSSDVRILCVGRLIERKGQHHLLRALADLCGRAPSEVKLVIVGTGDAEDSLRRLADDLGVLDKVTFTGFVPREEMPAVYQKADIFALPSQSEGMSIALLEAMATGLPVIVTDAGGTAELVQEGANGLVVPWADVSVLADALVTLVQDEPTRRRMGRQCRQIAREFGWSVMTQQYLEACEKVASRARAAPGATYQTHSEQAVPPPG